MITLEDLNKVELDLVEKSKLGIPEAKYSWSNSPLNIIDCVLSLNRKYETMVKPRVQFFFR